ncbi:hypothetical protein [Vulcanisaeta sp. JCM 14467]
MGMDILAFIIMTVALLALVIAFTWYMDYYTSMNLLNTANYVRSLVSSALKHEFETAISIASFNNVVGTFSFTLMLPTSSFSTQGLAINYNITLYPYQERGSNVIELMANITVMASIGPITRTTSTTILLYSSAQPYNITAYYCYNSTTHQMTTVNLVNSMWVGSRVPNPPPTCIWNNTNIQLGYAVISINKGYQG